MRRDPPRNRSNDTVSVRQVAGHFAMGASLGTIGALLLMISNAGVVQTLVVQTLVANGTGMPAAVFVAMCACTIAIGATLTGIIFSSIEDAQKPQ
jgi:hypothetical protein